MAFSTFGLSDAMTFSTSAVVSTYGVPLLMRFIVGGFLSLGDGYCWGAWKPIWAA